MKLPLNILYKYRAACINKRYPPPNSLLYEVACKNKITFHLYDLNILIVQCKDFFVSKQKCLRRVEKMLYTYKSIKLVKRLTLMPSIYLFSFFCVDFQMLF